jgi:HD-GYP domain-containing protein (c-di-GMP phosphodiesterase class II)
MFGYDRGNTLYGQRLLKAANMERSRIMLCGISPQFEGLQWESNTLIRVGRMDNMEIILNVPSVSRRHAEVLITPRGWVVRDLGSMNGTFLNGVRVGRSEQSLRLHDVLQVGDVSLKVTELEESLPTGGANGQPSIKTSGSFVRVEAATKHPWDRAVEPLVLPNNPRLRQDKGFLTLLRTGYHIAHIDSLDQLLQSILDDTVGVLNAHRGSMILVDEPTGKLQLQAVFAMGGPMGSEKCFSRTLSQRCFDEGQSLLCQNAQEDATVSIARGTMSSIICALLRTPRKKLGVLHLDRGIMQDPFTQEDFCLADAIAASVSVAIESAQLMKQQQDLSVHTVTALAQAVELRDQYTGGHTQRVTTYALMLAEELKIPPEDQQKLRIGVPLHDIGKIGIDDDILRKAGKLTQAEYEQMKLHTIKGAAILEAIPNMANLLPIVRHHHERWDGNGYPDGLANQQISRLARIVAVADAFDAMTTDRPYRPAMSLDQAFAELSQKAGTHFDPECVAAFLRIRPQIETIREQEDELQQNCDQLTRTFLSKDLVSHLSTLRGRKA